MLSRSLSLTCSLFFLPAGPAQVIPIFKGDKAFDASGRPLRKSLALPTWSKLAGKDRLELDMQLSCEGSSDAGKWHGWLGLAWLGLAWLGSGFGDRIDASRCGQQRQAQRAPACGGARYDRGAEVLVTLAASL